MSVDELESRQARPALPLRWALLAVVWAWLSLLAWVLLA
jgi:hypothetical protein